jgi:hypothetical protein
MEHGNGAPPVVVENWAAIVGQWSFGAGDAQYLGPSKAQPSPYHGVAVSDVQLRDGVVRAGIRFEVFDQQEPPTGGVILGFRSQRDSYVMAQLGAYGSEFAISEFEPTSGWRALERAGSSENLITGRSYAVEVTQRGQGLFMVVDHVPIFNLVLPSPLVGNQVGLFAWGPLPVFFSRITAQQERPRAFVAMQFGEPYDTIYREVIKLGAKDAGFDVLRIDETVGPGLIFEDIKREIGEAKVVIAEITAPNQNVFYEVGYAHALNKPTILLAQRGRELPFDIRSYRVIFYEDTIGGKPNVEKSLAKHLNSILKDL